MFLNNEEYVMVRFYLSTAPSAVQIHKNFSFFYHFKDKKMIEKSNGLRVKCVWNSLKSLNE